MKNLKSVPVIKSLQHGWVDTLREYIGLKHNSRRGALLEKLQHQRFLLRTGKETTAHVMEVETMGSIVNDLQEINLVLSLHMPGQTTAAFVKTSSVVACHHLPRPGDKINIRYIPGDTSAMLIL